MTPYHQTCCRVAITIPLFKSLVGLDRDAYSQNDAFTSGYRDVGLGHVHIFYACETWTITADIERRTQALEMRCFHKLLGILYRDRITNEEVKARIGNAFGPYEDLLTSLTRRKLKWYGHITRSSGLAKTILQGTG